MSTSARPRLPRAHPRMAASAIPSITAVRLSASDASRATIASGMLVDLVNMSLSGMLVEGRTRLVPGSRVTVTIEGGFEPAQVRAKIVRCQVTSIVDGALRYQCGLQFDHPLDRLVADPEPDSESDVASATPTPGPHPGSPLEPRVADRRALNRW